MTTAKALPNNLQVVRNVQESSITFDPEQFKLDYPQFSQLSDNYLIGVFNNEALVLGAAVINAVSGYANKSYWAQVVLAHILTITGTGVGTGQTGMVNNASEGDVSGSFDYKVTLNNQWWAQTAYGQKCWQIINVRGGATYFPDFNNLYNVGIW